MQTDTSDQSLTPKRSEESEKRTVNFEADKSDTAQGQSANDITGNGLAKPAAKAKRFHAMTPKRVAAVQRMQEGKKRLLEEKRNQTSNMASRIKSASKSVGMKQDRAEEKVMMVEDPQMERIERDHPRVTREMEEGVEVTVHEPMDKAMPKKLRDQIERNRESSEGFSQKELLQVLEAYKELATLKLQAESLKLPKGGRRRRRRADYSSDEDDSDSELSDYEPRRRRSKSRKRKETAKPESKSLPAEQLQNMAGRKAEMYSAAVRSFGSNNIGGLKWQTSK